VYVGRFPDTTIEEARKRAGRINSQIDAGVNPNELKREHRAELTLAGLFDLYMERHARAHNRKPSNAQNNYRRYLSQWSGRKLSGITRGDVAMLHAKLGTEIGHATANIAVTLLRALYNKAVVWELWTGGNPTFGIKKFREVARERFLLPDEMPRFLESLREVKDETTRDFILLLLMTGARRGNVQAMQWEDVNLESALWRIPDTKIGEPHTVALSPEAIAVLSKRKESAKGDYVFPGPGKSKHLEEPKRAWVGVLERAGIKELRLHDLRRTHGSWMAASGASLPMIGKALGHKNVSTTAIYARLSLDPVRAAVTKANASIFRSAGNLIPSAKIATLEDASTTQVVRGGSA
jgi:integrase